MSGRLRIVAAISLLALLLLASGCATGTTGPGSPGTASGPVSLSEKDDGSNVTLGVGQKLEVVLKSNQTTGYQWAIDTKPEACLEQVDEPTYDSASGSTGMVGAGGKETWVFEGKSAGTTPLKLKYWRSFEPTAAPAATFEVIVEVK